MTTATQETGRTKELTSVTVPHYPSRTRTEKYTIAAIADGYTLTGPRSINSVKPNPDFYGWTCTCQGWATDNARRVAVGAAGGKCRHTELVDRYADVLADLVANPAPAPKPTRSAFVNQLTDLQRETLADFDPFSDVAEGGMTTMTTTTNACPNCDNGTILVTPGDYASKTLPEYGPCDLCEGGQLTGAAVDARIDAARQADQACVNCNGNGTTYTISNGYPEPCACTAPLIVAPATPEQLAAMNAMYDTLIAAGVATEDERRAELAPDLSRSEAYPIFRSLQARCRVAAGYYRKPSTSRRNGAVSW